MSQLKLIAGIELSARQFTAAVGELQNQRRLVVQAVESIPAQGFEKEGLSDPIECADAVARLIRQVERSLPAKVSSAMAAFPSNHLKSFDAEASIPIPDPTVGISRQDVERAISTCRTLSLDYDRQILHAFERGFTVDGQSGVRNPVGLSGKKLEVALHLVTALNHTTQNLTRVLNRAGLELEGFALPGLGASEAVLSDLDRDLGVTFIRIGDFQTEVVLFDDGEVRETFLISGGAEDLVESLSRVFKLPRISAEHLFEQVRSIEEKPPTEGNPNWASFPLRAGVGASVRTFPQGEVVQLVRTKAKDLLQRVQRRLVTSPIFLDSASGVVMVGHLSRLEGFLEMAEGMLNMPVRLGMVKDVELGAGVTLRTQDLTAVGLIRYSLRRRLTATASTLPPWLRPLEKVQRLLQEYF